ncbi:lipocalin family protein [Alteromonas sp. ASW11-130]|uniref:lipocalin family protein n=1 Tax=Alteromonas sp. ASW11-130 TaxID=3015775 RepID=UPI002241AA84|nr:lipocalin family protein [Alteromonas sp. ASW11-130]MCW8090740.1 lipocalin family protein [Alteromonas sp. ASW11-130]
MRLIILVIIAALTSCTGVPDNIKPVTNFELSRYLGKWYEIARLPHSFEEGLSHVTAQYSLREDGGVKVINRGYNKEEQEWDEAEGKAYFVKDENTGHLKVSFFGPFYASYVIINVDENYQHALVTGPDRDYLWLLSRTPELSSDVMEKLVEQAAALGYPVNDLIFVKHEPDV